MDNPNVTMEEYIRIEEEKARSRGLMFDWQTTKFGRMEHNYEEDRFTNFEEEFPAIVYEKINGESFDMEQMGIMNENDEEREDYMNEFPAIVFNMTSDTTPPYEPTVSPPNESELDFRISCDKSDDEDYTVIFDENSFSYKIVSVNDLKTVSENDDSRSTSSPNPTIDHDLDYFNDFENEFPAIVYNDGLTSKSDLGIKTLVSTTSTDEFNSTDETSLSEYDETSRFNDLFNDTHSVDSKLEINNDDNNIGIVQLSEGNEREDGFPETSHDETSENFKIRNLVTNLSIVIYYCVIGMLFFLITNLYVPFGIPFDPKRYYKDGPQTDVAEAKSDMPYQTIPNTAFTYGDLAVNEIDFNILSENTSC
ncbi:hypothetical protein Tco_0667858 [Tanacetum coccineum]